MCALSAEHRVFARQLATHKRHKIKINAGSSPEKKRSIAPPPAPVAAKPRISNNVDVGPKARQTDFELVAWRESACSNVAQRPHLVADDSALGAPAAAVE
jgi:hypothetical protein